MRRSGPRLLIESGAREGGWLEIDFATAFEVVADTLGPQDALVQGDRRLSWSTFDDTSARLAAAFKGAGIEGGQGGHLPVNCPEYLLAQNAAYKHRATPST